MICRKAGRTNRVKRHGGSRRGDVPEGETCFNQVACLELEVRDLSFEWGWSLLRRLTKQEDMIAKKWAEHGRFCIEDAAILDNHKDSWIAKYLLDQGFRDATPNAYRRAGPWMWIDVNGMTFRYHPRYGVGYGTPIADVHLTGLDFMMLWEILLRRKKENAFIGGGWQERILAQRNSGVKQFNG